MPSLLVEWWSLLELDILSSMLFRTGEKEVVALLLVGGCCDGLTTAPVIVLDRVTFFSATIQIVH